MLMAKKELITIIFFYICLIPNASNIILDIMIHDGGHRKLSTFNLPTKYEDNHQQNFHAALFNMKYAN